MQAVERKQLIYFLEGFDREGESGGEPVGRGRGLGHPHRHFQRKAGRISHRVGAFGMSRRGNDRQGFRGVRMERIKNRHGGRHGFIECFS